MSFKMKNNERQGLFQLCLLFLVYPPIETSKGQFPSDDFDDVVSQMFSLKKAIQKYPLWPHVLSMKLSVNRGWKIVTTYFKFSNLSVAPQCSIYVILFIILM